MLQWENSDHMVVIAMYESDYIVKNIYHMYKLFLLSKAATCRNLPIIMASTS